jgi:uncharacterized membrane protein YbhN (UPF0104 family)
MADDEDQDSGGWSRRTLVLVVLGVLVLYGVGAAFADIGEAFEEFTGGSVLPLIGAGVGHAVVTLLWPQVFRVSARSVGGELAYREALNVALSSYALSHTAPGGGAVGAAVGVSRMESYGLSGPAAASAGALTVMLSMTTAAAIGVAGIATAVVTGDLPDDWLWLAILAMVVLAGIVVGMVAVLRSPRAGDWVIAQLARLPKLEDHAEGWRSSLREITEDDPPSTLDLARISAWAALKWTAAIASLALVFVAFGQTPRLTILLVGFGVSQLAAAIPITPGGVGFVEGGMVASFVAFGISTSLATTIVLVYRVFEVWGPVVAGVPALLKPPEG